MEPPPAKVMRRESEQFDRSRGYKSSPHHDRYSRERSDDLERYTPPRNRYDQRRSSQSQYDYKYSRSSGGGGSDRGFRGSDHAVSLMDSHRRHSYHGSSRTLNYDYR